eukprot:scaffold10465_cov30-Attheya_sp.AAC.3
MSSDEENDDVEVGAAIQLLLLLQRKKNNNIAVIQAKNKELEAEIEVLNEKDKDWEALNADKNIGVISELRKRLATLNKIASNLEAKVRVAQGQAQHAQNNGIDTTIEMDAVENDRVCRYVRKTMFRKVKFTLDTALDLVQKGSIGGAISEAFNINEDDGLSWWHCYKQAAHHGIAQSRNGKITEIKNWAKKLYEDNNGIMPTLDEVLRLPEETRWDPEDDNRI